MDTKNKGYNCLMISYLYFIYGICADTTPVLLSS